MLIKQSRTNRSTETIVSAGLVEVSTGGSVDVVAPFAVGGVLPVNTITFLRET